MRIGFALMASAALIAAGVLGWGLVSRPTPPPAATPTQLDFSTPNQRTQLVAVSLSTNTGEETHTVSADAWKSYTVSVLRGLEQEREALKTEAKAMLAAALDRVFADANRRVRDDFAEWHYSFGASLSSTYLTAQEGVLGSLNWLLGEDEDVAGRIEAALADDFRRRFDDLVLRPHERAALIHTELAAIARNLHRKYARIVKYQRISLREFLQLNGSPISRAEIESRISLDWRRAALTTPSETAARAFLDDMALIGMSTAGGAALGAGLTALLDSTLTTLIGDLIGRTAVFTTLEAGLGATGAGAAVAAGVAYVWIKVSESWERDSFEQRHIDAVDAIKAGWTDILAQDLGAELDRWMDELGAAIIERA